MPNAESFRSPHAAVRIQCVASGLEAPFLKKVAWRLKTL